MSKRARIDTDDADGALERCVAEANRLIGKKAWFVCFGCDKLCLGRGEDMETSKWGYERVFCDTCVLHCDGCDEDYVDSMAYRHDDCPKEKSSSSSSSSSDEDE